MNIDIFEKLNSKAPFRSIGISEELLENILLIPAERAPCPYAPIIKVERKLSYEQIKDMMVCDEEKYENFYRVLGIDASKVEIPAFVEILTFKDTLIKKDVLLLTEIVATDYYLKARGLIQVSDWSNLYQIVEIDWTFNDLYPGEQAIHYEVFTKREIFARVEGDK